VGVFLRKAGAAPEDAEISKLPPAAQPMVRQALKEIEAETDAAKLQQMIAQLQGAAGQAPAEMKPAIDLILQRAGERLAALAAEKK